MAVYSVDSDAVLSATTAVRGTMERVQGDTHAMLAQLTHLQSSWTGTAAASFHGVIEQWRGVQQQVEESLGAIGGALAVAAQQYAEAEQFSANLFR
ncbi:WXG100 family type VII secretion target [Microbacterium sp.]|uniref:WXG100 family type VII secretion target n=1 Tax=Microbacterium sp. TaxID=51671 RepID=UPI000928C696|nr:WXG100 family type VII secretion target [Microbacterium sp.]MBN9179537.1 WXG100 family type VII secretion target [Microbacterium sp.]MBN9184877.1 WXG100 family type VII secretion target [Microbacterium sp.]MBN9194334.1 WXG100 family type VII secretion target [Microbacterium sp.]OJU67580.1 MAG: type VII secretion protein [Microbacterium sp. 70-38]